MGSDSVARVLEEVEGIRKAHGHSTKRMAGLVGIPYATYRRWFLPEESKTAPSRENLDILRAFLAVQSMPDSQRGPASRKEPDSRETPESRKKLDSQETQDSRRKADARPDGLWMAFLRWWKTQHKYSSVEQLAAETGWNAEKLSSHINNGEAPPILVIETLAEKADLGMADMAALTCEAGQRIEKLKHVLLVLEDELRWFRDRPQEAREVFRSKLDPNDVGYIASLLTMLGDESKFRRWLELTSNRFNSFRKAGSRKTGGRK